MTLDELALKLRSASPDGHIGVALRWNPRLQIFCVGVASDGDSAEHRFHVEEIAAANERTDGPTVVRSDVLGEMASRLINEVLGTSPRS